MPSKAPANGMLARQLEGKNLVKTVQNRQFPAISKQNFRRWHNFWLILIYSVRKTSEFQIFRRKFI